MYPLGPLCVRGLVWDMQATWVSARGAHTGLCPLGVSRVYPGFPVQAPGVGQSALWSLGCLWVDPCLRTPQVQAGASRLFQALLCLPTSLSLRGPPALPHPTPSELKD